MATNYVDKTNVGGVDYDLRDIATRALIAGEYDSSTTYTLGSFCIYNNELYVATAETRGTWDSSKWNKYTVGEVIRGLAAALIWKVAGTANAKNSQEITVPSTATELLVKLRLRAKTSGVYQTLSAHTVLGSTFNNDTYESITPSIYLNAENNATVICGVYIDSTGTKKLKVYDFGAKLEGTSYTLSTMDTVSVELWYK